MKEEIKKRVPKPNPAANARPKINKKMPEAPIKPVKEQKKGAKKPNAVIPMNMNDRPKEEKKIKTRSPEKMTDFVQDSDKDIAERLQAEEYKEKVETSQEMSSPKLPSTYKVEQLIPDRPHYMNPAAHKDIPNKIGKKVPAANKKYITTMLIT